MYIGSKSDSTLLQVFQTGLRELTRDMGKPAKLRFKTEGCEMYAQAADFETRVDLLRIEFPLKDGISPQEMSEKLSSGKVPCRVQLKDGKCTLTVPPFEVRHVPKLSIVNEVVESSAATSLRSQTWNLEPEEFTHTGFNINELIEEMEEKKASDLHLRAGSPPFIRIDNDLFPLEGRPAITRDDMVELMIQLGGQAELDMLMTERESSFQYHAAGIGYLRCSGYIKAGAMALAIRLIPEEPLPFEALNIPPQVQKVCSAHRGLFLVCGVTGSGKSTTLASMLDYINQTRSKHIITTEDPIEFVYKDKKSIISQRQVGRDTFSFANALRGALREDPDVILVGEMRDIETIRAALSAAETGHLVFSTLHTTTAVDTVNRVISYFPQSERDLIRQELAYTLQGVVCQRLLKRKGGGRIPCVEILLGGRPIVRDAILEGDLDKLWGIIEVDAEMSSFDQYAVKLYQEGKVERAEAISACTDVESFERVVSGIRTSSGKLLG